MLGKTIRDAVHGDCPLDPVAITLIDTSTFQRLRGIKQLGTASLVYPSAVHTRFEHSLGTYTLTRRLLSNLRTNLNAPELLLDDEPALTIAALLHDITHIPFGHTLEDERRLFPRHDQHPTRLAYFLDDSPLGDRLRAAGLHAAVRSLLGTGPALPLHRALIRGSISADLLDYLKRDALFCGLHLDYDERIFRYLTIADGQLVFDLQKNGQFRPDAFSEITHLLRMRYTLTERVYFHPAKVVSGAMLSRAVEWALADGLLTEETLYDLRDDVLLHLLAGFGQAHVGIRNIVDDLAAHRFYRPAYRVRRMGRSGVGIDAVIQERLAQKYHYVPAERQALEVAVATQVGLPASDVLVYCPSAEMSLKEANLLVKLDAGPPVPLATLADPELRLLQDAHRGLWAMSVYLRQGREPFLAEAGRCVEEFLHLPNQLRP